MRILVIEDDIDILNNISEYLQLNGYLVDSASDGLQAMNLVDLIYAELSGDFPLGDSRQPTYKSLRPFDLVS